MVKGVAERFLSKVIFNNGCCVWGGATDGHGYGVLWHGVGVEKAHRVSWELFNGLIPKGLWVLHKCDNPPCVNPSHLFLGNRSDNMKDMWAKNRRPRSWRRGHR